MLALIPMGNGVVTVCGLLSLLGSDPHHHEGSSSDTLCLDSEAHHHEEQQVPCSDDCMLDLPEASLFKVQCKKLLSLTSFIPIRDMPDRLTRTSGNTLLVVVPTRIKPPPNDSSPPFTGRFLI
ncbi:MAG: hypothetical protein HN627_07325 [Opitutae bacterium]|nr:hypothetical protein [Opitutae bacterium]